MKSIGLAVLISLFLGQAIAARASDVEFQYAILTSSITSASTTGGGCGLRTSGSDGYDTWDMPLPAGQRAYHGTYHVNGDDGWLGPTGFYPMDVRSPVAMTPGRSKTWIMYVWADPSLPGSDHEDILLLWSSSIYSPQFQCTLTLLAKPAGVVGGPAVGTTWDLSHIPDQGQSGGPGVPSGSFHLLMFRTANGLEGYVFDFTATVIPEPSSLLALLAGLGGLGGMIWRRRR